MSDVITGEYINPEHASAFKAAARRWRVWILVRQSNPHSQKYMGRAGYAPKRLDCKAKTARQDLPKKAPLTGMYRLAGLVVDPTIHPAAFAGRDVMDTWRAFQPHLYKPAPGERRVYLPAGKLYTVQLDPAHDHYGCVAFTGYGLSTNLNYIYGDYDLYGIVSEEDPSQNIFVEETRLHPDMPHSRSPEFFDVQHYLNRHIGIPMILHGSQEKYSGHTEDNVIVFWPDGAKVTEARGKAALEALYRDEFQGRRPHGPGAEPHFGRWKKA